MGILDGIDNHFGIDLLEGIYIEFLLWQVGYELFTVPI